MLVNNTKTFPTERTVLSFEFNCTKRSKLEEYYAHCKFCRHDTHICSFGGVWRQNVVQRNILNIWKSNIAYSRDYKCGEKKKNILHFGFWIGVLGEITLFIQVNDQRWCEAARSKVIDFLIIAISSNIILSRMTHATGINVRSVLV